MTPTGRHIMWSPLPPARSGIADYSFELLAALATEINVDAVADSMAARTPPGVRLLAQQAVGSPDAVHLYHMGNHAGAHEWIYRQALAEPGVVVLHDTSLMDFQVGLFGGIHTQDFRDEVAYAHGPIWGTPSDPALIEGWPAIEVDGVRTLDRATLSMERRLIERSRGVIVHDEFSAGWLRQRYPDVPVVVVPSGAPIVADRGQRSSTRAKLGWRDDDVVFGIFGGFNRIKRAQVAVLAFAQIRRRWPQARLLMCGHADDKAVLADVNETIAQLGVSNSVHIAQSPSIQEFEDLIVSADAVINLRWPTAGETSAVMMRAFGAGRVVITSDLPQHRHLDPAFCWRVSTEPAKEAEVLLSLMERAVLSPEDTRDAGDAARRYVESSASWPVVARRYREALDHMRAAPAPNLADVPSLNVPGLNVFADARATTGLAESARRHATALADAGVPMTFTEFNSMAPNRSLPVPQRLADLRSGKDYPVDLWLVNLNEFQLIPETAIDRYTIGLWAWELPEVVSHTLVQLPRLDELWVLSSFVGEAFRTVTDIPITVVPCVVPPITGVTADRARFGIPDDGVVVLFTFSASSSDARKNPWGVIDAYRQAFTAQERGTTAHLVVKVVDLHSFPELGAALTEAVASVGGVIISEDLSRHDMDTLLATCDIYVSLHRSEGFGLGMAEAMSLGKAVVATGFGGNTDFMPPGSAATVGYQPRIISDRDHRFAAAFGDWYQPGQMWAEPNIAQAARWLRRLADSETLRRDMGERAAQAVEKICSPEAVGAVMSRRLAEIDRRQT